HERLRRQEEHAMTGLDGLDAEGQGEMGLADTGWAQQDDVLRPFDEAQSRQLAHDLAIEAGLEAEVELVERLHPWQPSLSEPGLDALEVAALPLGVQRLGEKLPVAELAFGRLLADRVELSAEVLQAQLLQQ